MITWSRLALNQPVCKCSASLKPTMPSSVLTALKAMAPETPKKVYERIGESLKSMRFSAMDSMTAELICAPVRPLESLLEKCEYFFASVRSSDAMALAAAFAQSVSSFMQIVSLRRIMAKKAYTKRLM